MGHGSSHKAMTPLLGLMAHFRLSRIVRRSLPKEHRDDVRDTAPRFAQEGARPERGAVSAGDTQ
jgi:hypothetical protein